LGSVPRVTSVCLLVASLLVPGSSIHVRAQTPTPIPLFRIESDELWLNLHHFLHALGRAQAKMADASRAAIANAPVESVRELANLSTTEQQLWSAAIAAYATGISRRDLIFDASLAPIATALGTAGEQPTRPKLTDETGVVAVLQSVVPIYRRTWWPSHRAANRAWKSSMEDLLRQHGQPLVTFVSSGYELPWETHGYVVHASAYANWAGAYSTAGKLLVVSSQDSGTRGLYGLEQLLHEAMHQWDGPVMAALQTQAGPLNVSVPRDLTHALIFYTAGYAVQRAVPSHAPYAGAFNVWPQRLSGSQLPAERLKPAIESIWKRHLDGEGARRIASRTAQDNPPVSAHN
jgi:hypothetical protein